MPKDVVMLFAGQGAQKVGMAKDLAENHKPTADLFAQANDVLGFDLSASTFDGPIEELTRTSRCQPALYLHGVACLNILKERVPDLNPVAAAGLSLGEFTAHAAAGTFDFETGLKLVGKRGAFMEEATNANKGTMAAMMGGSDDAVRELADACDVDVANFNAPGQIVISGSEEGIDKAIAGAKEKGIRIAKKLEVAGAYHSRLMKSAQDQLVPVLDDAAIGTPTVPVYCNVDARPVEDDADIRETLARQVSGSVRWSESIQKLIAEGHSTFLELGPGGILAGLMKRIDKSVSVIRVEDQDTIEAAVTALS